MAHSLRLKTRTRNISSRAMSSGQWLQTLEGTIQFDKNGDLLHPVISIFRVTHDSKVSDTDLSQFKCVGTTSP
jgi:ABC-type branched-subunit amino acid transport system substrate-binding protein